MANMFRTIAVDGTIQYFEVGLQNGLTTMLEENHHSSNSDLWPWDLSNFSLGFFFFFLQKQNNNNNNRSKFSINTLNKCNRHERASRKCHQKEQLWSPSDDTRFACPCRNVQDPIILKLIQNSIEMSKSDYFKWRLLPDIYWFTRRNARWLRGTSVTPGKDDLSYHISLLENWLGMATNHKSC